MAKLFSYEDFEPKTSAYCRREQYKRWYEKNKKSVRKKPIMTEEERRLAHNRASLKHRMKAASMQRTHNTTKNKREDFIPHK